MPSDLLNLSLGFIEGFALIISPCVLPILPLVLAGSLSGSKKRPLGIMAGFVIIFALFTLFSRQLVAYSGIDLNLLREFSFALLFVLGLIMVSPKLSEQFTRLTQRLANLGSRFSVINNPESGFMGGFCFGGLVALIWTPCAGPILAAVIVQTVLQQTTIMSSFVVLSFALGVALPMLLIILFGRQVLTRVTFLKEHSQLLRKTLGIIIIASVLYMILSGSGLSTLAPSKESKSAGQQLEKGLEIPTAAPELMGLNLWINSPPLTLSELRGKVVLIDFWTYSCINCIRTLPYLNAWYNKYHSQGLVIIGVHTPEFDFEKDPTNVKRAVAEEGIQYPVALDNQFATWQSFANRYWPAHYLINQEGKVVYVHYGEGDYEVTENNIRFLLGLAKANTETRAVEASSYTLTPETYLGTARAKNFASPEAPQTGKTAAYTFPQTLALNAWALSGSWQLEPDRVVSVSPDAAVIIHFQARQLYVVMGSQSNLPLTVEIKLNGQPLQSGAAKTITQSRLSIQGTTLYQILDLAQFSEGKLEIHPLTPGLEIYTFTFGS